MKTFKLLAVGLLAFLGFVSSASAYNPTPKDLYLKVKCDTTKSVALLSAAIKKNLFLKIANLNLVPSTIKINPKFQRVSDTNLGDEPYQNYMSGINSGAVQLNQSPEGNYINFSGFSGGTVNNQFNCTVNYKLKVMVSAKGYTFGGNIIKFTGETPSVNVTLHGTRVTR